MNSLIMLIYMCDHHLNMGMARHWPYHSRLQVKSGDHMRQILTWAHVRFGDTSYQHWSSEYAHPWLCVYFCDQQCKVEFDLTWIS